MKSMNVVVMITMIGGDDDGVNIDSGDDDDGVDNDSDDDDDDVYEYDEDK